MMIPISNPSFEELVVENAQFQPVLPGWQGYDPNKLVDPVDQTGFGTFNPGTDTYFGEAPNGTNVAGIYVAKPPGSGVLGFSQTTNALLTANTTYTLKADVGNILVFGPYAELAGFPGYAIQLLVDGKVIAEDTTSANPTEGNFTTATLTYTPSANDPNIGKPIEIRLLNALRTTGAETSYDNVRFEATPVPAIANPGFEDPVRVDGDFTRLSVPGWRAYDPSNFFAGEGDNFSNYSVFNPAKSSYPNEAPQGQNATAVFLGFPPGSGVAGLSQILPGSLMPNMTYHLQAKVGNPNPDDFAPPGFPGYAVQLLAGGKVIAQDVNGQHPGEGTFSTSNVTYTSTANDPNFGKPLEIRLLNLLGDPAKEVNFDDVRLDISPATPDILNASFEETVVADAVFKPGLPGWEGYDPSRLISDTDQSGYGTFNPASDTYPAGAPDGTNVAGIYVAKPPGSGVVGFSQKINKRLTADTTYTLKADVGNILVFGPYAELAGFPGYAIQMLVDGKVIAEDTNSANPSVEGTFAPATLTYTASANDPNLGKQIEIRLLNALRTTGAETSFDNVRLTEAKVPKNFFDEAFYLQNNGDVAAAVRSGQIASGLSHFNIFGRREGRTSVSRYYNEASYLQKYSDVATAVRGGGYSSGLQHFMEAGYDEGRSPDAGTANAEQNYLQKYRDVSTAVGAGILKSWYAHYLQFGLAEGRTPDLSGGSFALKPDAGDGEIDTLVGTPGVDYFNLASSNADYALIKNFEKGVDFVQLKGSIDNYSQEVSGGNLNILAKDTRDLVAVVEGITNSLVPSSASIAEPGIFFVS